jgi:hypothetical protein
MLERCLYQKHHCYSDYGKRGIDVCDRWIFSFQYFLDDMGERPTVKHTLDRIDPNGNYTPDNCRWATPQEQARNKRDTLKLTFQGETKPLISFAEEYDIPYATLHARITKGWSTEKAITTPVARRQQRRPPLTAFGETKSISEWASRYSIQYTTITYRLDTDWSNEDAVSTPVKSPKLISALGKTQTIKEWSEETGIPTNVINTRINRGVTPKDALSTPTDSRSRYIMFDGREQTLKEWTDELEIPYVATLKRLRRGWPTEEAFIKPFRGR